jgi:hypothetical protein
MIDHLFLYQIINFLALCSSRNLSIKIVQCFLLNGLIFMGR